MKFYANTKTALLLALGPAFAGVMAAFAFGAMTHEAMAGDFWMAALCGAVSGWCVVVMYGEIRTSRSHWRRYEEMDREWAEFRRHLMALATEHGYTWHHDGTAPSVGDGDTVRVMIDDGQQAPYPAYYSVGSGFRTEAGGPISGVVGWAARVAPPSKGERA